MINSNQTTLATLKRVLVFSVLDDDWTHLPKERKIIEGFRKSYTGPTAPASNSYTTFCAVGSTGIPKYVQIYQTFDPPNTGLRHQIFDQKMCISALNAHRQHLFCYLNAPEFDVSLGSHSTYDATVHAIISYILRFNDESLLSMGKQYPVHKRLMEALQEERARDHGAYCYNYNGMPYIKTAFKMLRHVKELPIERLFRPTMRISDYFVPNFMNHLEMVYNLLAHETATQKDFKMLQAFMPLPYTEALGIITMAPNDTKNRVKFITGQACCGKTTLLNSLTAHGWKIMSRNSVGSFSGKAENAAVVTTLHAANEYVLTKSNVLGDRSIIDNQLWQVIMPECEHTKRNTTVQNVVKFLVSLYNVPALQYFIGQQGIIFIDTYPSICAKRMMTRNDGGDAYRGRLKQYAIAQAIAYYIVARLFGWKVYCVPYTAERVFDPQQYTVIAEELIQSFGPIAPTNQLTVDSFDRPPNDYSVDNYFPKAVGIYK